MFVKSLSHAKGFHDRGNSLWHSIGLSSSVPLLSATLSTIDIHIYRFHTSALTSQQVLNGLIKSAGILGILLRATNFHSAQALLWQQDFSLERNECANVLQVGFIKLRPGTLVLALHNYHVTKPGSRETLTYSYTAATQQMSIHTLHKNWEWEKKVLYTQTYCTCISTLIHILHAQLRFKRLISLLSDELFKTK